MKNLSGKTMIFYTFQQKKELQYNVIAYQAIQQPILIKDVIQQIPLSLSEGRYHFRFKSEFTQGNQKISGWIDINNLAAKVPMIGGSIYVKILKVKSNAHNKMFNLEKLSRVGLGIKAQKSKTVQQKIPQPPKKIQSSQINQKNINPISAKRQQKPASKPATQAKVQQIDLINSIYKNSPTNLHTKIPTVLQQKVQIKDKINKGQFEKPQVYKNDESIEDKLKFFYQTMNAQQKQKQNQIIARDELEQRINKWGYSGAKTINNLTTLLSTLHEIWPEWPQISLTELLNPRSLASHTKKALVKTHPDKNTQKPFREKYLAKRVFELVNDAKTASKMRHNV